jgi:hypothetical protein
MIHKQVIWLTQKVETLKRQNLKLITELKTFMSLRVSGSLGSHQVIALWHRGPEAMIKVCNVCCELVKGYIRLLIIYRRAVTSLNPSSWHFMSLLVAILVNPNHNNFQWQERTKRVYLAHVQMRIQEVERMNDYFVRSLLVVNKE